MNFDIALFLFQSRGACFFAIHETFLFFINANNEDGDEDDKEEDYDGKTDDFDEENDLEDSKKLVTMMTRESSSPFICSFN